MKCQHCNEEHNGDYGSGRFCKQKCARSFSTAMRRASINEKVAAKLTGRKLTKEHRDKLRETWHANGKRIASFEEVFVLGKTKRSNKFIKMRAINEGLFKEECVGCGITNTYNGRPIVLQLHHKNGDNKDNRPTNIELRCPNCHSQTDNWAGKNRWRTRKDLNLQPL